MKDDIAAAVAFALIDFDTATDRYRARHGRDPDVATLAHMATSDECALDVVLAGNALTDLLEVYLPQHGLSFDEWRHQTRMTVIRTGW